MQESEQANSKCADDCGKFGLLLQTDILTSIPGDATPHQKQVYVTSGLMLCPSTIIPSLPN